MESQSKAWALGGATAVGLALAFVGCSTASKESTTAAAATDDSGSDDTATKKTTATSKKKKDAGTSSCDAKQTGECGTCMKDSCCNDLVACEEDPGCAACVSGEDPDACEKTPETHDRVNLYLACKGGACHDTCIGETAGSCKGLVTGVVAEACQTCMEASCCTEVSACKGATVCWDGCFTNRDETKCHNDPDGHAVYHAMTTCISKSCADACAK